MAEAVTPMRESWWAGWNPLRCTGTALPPSVLLAAKLIVLSLLLMGYVAKIPEPFVGIWPIFERLPRPDLVRLAMQVVFVIAAIGLLVNRSVRVCALAAGVVFLLIPLVSRGDYTNGKFFCGATLTLMGLYHDRRSIWLLRAQFVIMYFGSALNKLLEADWHNGQYMEHWLVHMRKSELYIAAADALPHMALSTAMGWATIVIEFALAAMFAFPRLTRPAIWLALLFHTGSVVLADSTFYVFYFALASAFLVLVDWPAPGDVTVTVHPGSRLWAMVRSVSARLDFDRVIRWRVETDPAATLTFGHRNYHRLGALVVCALIHPATYFVLIIVTTSIHGPKLHIALVVALIVACPLTAWLIDRIADVSSRAKLR